jgi:transcription-repair coupling factor (superfamily II helicase)
MIGFDLYCRLLKQEIARLRRSSREEMQQICDDDLMHDVEIKIDFIRPVLKSEDSTVITAAIPPEFIESERLRISAYRRLAEVRSESMLDDLADELRDRYGVLPQEAENLVTLNRLRIAASLQDIRKITVVDGAVYLQGAGGSIYRKDGRIPRLDYRDSCRLRIKKLLMLIQQL